MLKQAFAFVVVGAALALPAVATAQPAGADTPVQADANSESGASYRATDLLNSNVRSEDGQVVAEVEDFVLDSQTNQVQYVVLAYGDAAAEAQYYVLPANQFFVQREADTVYLQTPLTVDVIQRAPAFPRAQWVDVVRQPNWYVGVNRFWTGAGVDVNLNRGFGRRGQINAIDVDLLNSPNRAVRPGVIPGAVNPAGPAGGPGVGNPPGPIGGPGAGRNVDGGLNLPGRR